jgi:hypothetical protein
MDINTGNFIQLPASVGLSDSATCSSGRLTAFIGSSSGVPGVYLVTWSTGAVIRLM